MKTQFTWGNRINWRQILVHFLAAWSFIYACSLFSCLSDMRMTRIFTSGKDVNGMMKIMEMERITTTDVFYYLFYRNVIWTCGLLVAFLLSLIISIKRRWLWVNSIIASILVYLIFVNLFRLTYATSWHTTIYHNPFPLTVNWIIAMGTLSLLVGVYMFFSGRINRFIAGEIKFADVRKAANIENS